MWIAAALAMFDGAAVVFLLLLVPVWGEHPDDETLLGLMFPATEYPEAYSITPGRETRPYMEADPAFEGESTGLERTVILPTLDSEMPDDRNVVWCASFRVAWKSLERVMGGPVLTSEYVDLVMKLNASPSPAPIIPADSLYTAAGFCSDGIAETIETEMLDRFGKTPSLPEDMDEGGVIIAYSYLRASVPFEIPFFDNQEPLVFRDSRGRETEVTSFGIREIDIYGYRRLREQVEVLSFRYAEDGRFASEVVIDPCKTSAPNQIVLALVEPGETLQETLDHALEEVDWFDSRADEDARTIGMSQVLLIPNISFDVSHRFQEIEGKHLLKDPGLYIGDARQDISFNLDRSGADLESEAVTTIFCSYPSIVFDKPFLVFIRKRGVRQPFFVMWVDNAELLSEIHAG